MIRAFERVTDRVEFPKSREVKAMAKVGAQRAAVLTGKSKSTIQRAMNSGKISYELDSNGRRVIDVSELERAFGIKKQTTQAEPTAEQQMENVTKMIEIERMKMRIRMLEDKLDEARAQIEDLRQQRDQWQKQASQMLLTSRHSQEQADQLRKEIKEREQRARQRRQRQLEQKMQSMQAENENSQSEDGFTFKGFWKKVKKTA